MKLLKKLKDWKVWVFTILPIAMIAAWFAITITILASGKYTYRQRFDAWDDAVDRAYDASTTLNWITWGNYAAVAFVPISVGKRNSEEDKEKKQESQE